MNCEYPADPCPAIESGGVQCDEPRGHEDDLFGTPHGVSDHRRAHSMAGNGYSCEAIEENRLAEVPRRLMRFDVFQF